MVLDASARFARIATLRSSFVRLPAELVGECAQHLHQRDVVNLSTSCSLIRNTLLQIPAVWQRAVYIDTASQPFSELLRRSGILDLDLDIRLGLGTFVEDATNSLLQNMFRLRSLSIRFNAGPNPLDAHRVTRILSAAAPRLRSCVFRDPHYIYDYSTLARAHFSVPPVFDQHAPLLTTVKVTGRFDTFLTCGGAFNNVRQLVLHPERQILDLPHLLKATPALETLGIYCSKSLAIHATSANALGIATSRHLAELWVHIPRLRSMLSILRSINLANLKRTCVAIVAVDSYAIDAQDTGRALRSIAELYFGADTALEAHVRIKAPAEDGPNLAQYVVLLLRQAVLPSVERELVVHAIPIDALATILPVVRRLILDTLSPFTVNRMTHLFKTLGTCDAVEELQVHAICARWAMDILRPFDGGRRPMFPSLVRLGFNRVTIERKEIPPPILISSNLIDPRDLHRVSVCEVISQTLAWDVRAIAGARSIQHVDFVGWRIAECDQANLVGEMGLAERVTARDSGNDIAPTMWHRMDELSGFLKLRM